MGSQVEPENYCPDVLKGPCNRPGRDCAACPPAKERAMRILGQEAYEASGAGGVLIFYERPPGNISLIRSMLSLLGEPISLKGVEIAGGKVKHTKLQ
jgi:hypothetical protein